VEILKSFQHLSNVNKHRELIYGGKINTSLPLLLPKHNKEINHEIKYTFKHSFIQYDDEVGDEYP
jgi:hypothetical protein